MPATAPMYRSLPQPVCSSLASYHQDTFFYHTAVFLASAKEGRDALACQSQRALMIPRDNTPRSLEIQHTTSAELNATLTRVMWVVH